MALVYTRDSSGAIRRGLKLKPEASPPAKIVAQRGKFRLVPLGQSGFNVERQRSKGVWVKVCFKSRRDDALAEFNKLADLVDPRSVYTE